MKKNKKGFTLIELLIVIAIIAIIAAVVFVALDPLTRFQDARDAQRWTDVTAILSAVKVDQVDNGGGYLGSIYATATGTAYTIGTCSSGGNTGCTATTTASACVDLEGLVSEGYMSSVPYDPSTGDATETDYYLMKGWTGSMIIGACDPENASEIKLAR